VIGEEAANRMISDAQSTVSLTKLLLGKRFSELNPELVSSLPYKIQKGDRDQVMIKVNYGEEEKESLFTVPHVSAMVLKELVHYTTKYNNRTPKKVVIAIPSSWGAEEKRAITDAAKIAGLEVISLISENTAVALTYGFTHDLEEKDPPKNVAVVNLGHQFFAVQIVEYTKKKLRVLSSTCDSGIGGGVIDNRLVQHFAKDFKERYKGVDALSNVKARTRLQRACEKAKKVLSTIPETDLELDCLMDDIFVKGKIARTTLEGLIQDQLEKMKELIAKALSDACLKPDQIAEVEVVGGGLRIPSVQAAISEAFGGKELLKNIDGSSAVAEGAAIFAAISTPGFEFAYEVEDEFLRQQPAAEGLREAELQDAIERERKMDEKDRIRADTSAAKNQLETQLYDLRDKVNSDLFSQDVGSNEKKDELLSAFRGLEDWLYSDEGETASKEAIFEKLQELRNDIERISPALHRKLLEIQEQKEKELAQAAAERERKASEPSISSRDKTEKPLTKKEKFEAAKKRKNQGNICFKDGDFEGAVSRYVGAVTLADEIWDR
jgi:molecular chaperone DnaK (HSP70)